MGANAQAQYLREDCFVNVQLAAANTPHSRPYALEVLQKIYQWAARASKGKVSQVGQELDHHTASKP